MVKGWRYHTDGKACDPRTDCERWHTDVEPLRWRDDDFPVFPVGTPWVTTDGRRHVSPMERRHYHRDGEELVSVQMQEPSKKPRRMVGGDTWTEAHRGEHDEIEGCVVRGSRVNCRPAGARFVMKDVDPPVQVGGNLTRADGTPLGTYDPPPAHYDGGSIDAWAVWDAFDLDRYTANAVKYLLRAGKKDIAPRLDDLKKAANYIAKAIEMEQKKA